MILRFCTKVGTWNRNLLENEGRPSGVLFYPPVSMGASKPLVGGGQQKGTKKVEEEAKHFFAGAENAGKILILKGGFTI